MDQIPQKSSIQALSPPKKKQSGSTKTPARRNTRDLKILSQILFYASSMDNYLKNQHKKLHVSYTLG